MWVLLSSHYHPDSHQTFRIASSQRTWPPMSLNRSFRHALSVDTSTEVFLASVDKG